MDTKQAWKNITSLFLSFALVFGPHVGILSLQSSINSDEGLGLAGAAITYAFKGISLPLVPVIYSLIGSKYSMIIGYVSTIVYAGCNYYPSWYTLVPGSIVMGMGLGLMNVNSFTYTSETASQYASSLGKNYEHTVALFLAIFTAAGIKGALILGNLVSSSVLFNLDYNETDTLSNVSDQTCDNMGAEYVEKDYLYYVLMSVYILLTMIGIALAIILLDNYKTDDKFQSFHVSILEQITTMTQLFKLFFTYKMLLMFPLFVVIGLTFGFISGSFAKVFVSDCIGVEMIGFMVSVNSAVSLLMGILFGWLRRLIPAFVFILLGILISEGLTLFLLFWSREPSYYAVFGFAVGWGICDAIWLSIVSGVVGFVFSETKSPAFTIFDFGISVGVVITFVSGIFLPISTHLWIIFSIILYAGISYTILVIIMNVNKKLSKLTETQSSDVASTDESKLLIKNHDPKILYGTSDSVKIPKETTT